jgi:polysaccharide export outer membrane protein
MKVHIVGQELPRALIRSAARAVLALIAVLPLATAPVMTAAEEEVFEYRISPEDVLEISVWKEEDLQRKVIVRQDGGVSFPLAGDIQAAGRTPKELESNITEKLQAFIPDAVVTVSVLEIRGLRIYVTGKVKSPGQYTVGRYIDVLQALTMAGGLTTFADTNDIRIIRREDGREVVYRFNYDDVESGKELQQNIVLRTDDVVVVP